MFKHTRILAVIITAAIVMSFASISAQASEGNVIFANADITVTETKIDGNYEFMSSIGNGLFLVGRKAEPNDLCGIIDKTGKTVVPILGDSIDILKNGYYRITKNYHLDGVAANQWALYSSDGKVIVALGALSINEIIGDKYIDVSFGNLHGLIDFSGKIVVPVAFISVTPMSDGNFRVSVPTGFNALPSGEYHPGYFVGNDLLSQDYSSLNEQGKTAIQSGYDIKQYGGQAYAMPDTGTTMTVSVDKAFSTQSGLFSKFFGYTLCLGEISPGRFLVQKDRAKDTTEVIDANGKLLGVYDRAKEGLVINISGKEYTNFTKIREIPELYENQVYNDDYTVRKTLINVGERKVIADGYEYLEYLNDGYAKTCVDWFGYGYAEQKWGLVNKTAALIANKYNDIQYFGDNLFRIGMYDVNYQGKTVFRYGVVDNKGNEIVPIQFSSISYSATDKTLLAVSLSSENAAYKFYDITGKVLCDGNSYAANFSNGLAYVGTKDRFGTATYIDKSGKAVITLKNDNETEIFFGSDFISGLAFVRFWSNSKYESKYGFIDKRGKTVIPATYDKIDFQQYHAVSSFVYDKPKQFGAGWTALSENAAAFKYGYCTAQKGNVWYILSVSKGTPALNNPSSWAKASVDKAKTIELATSDLTNDYQAATTRAEFCRAAVNFLRKYGYDVDGVMPKLFEDTSDKDIGIAAALGITSGTDTAKNLFSPNGTLTREQAATMLRNVMNVIGVKYDTTAVKWTDAKDVSSWAKEASDAMYSAKIMGGTSTTALVFSPKTPYTHEQSIITLLNLWEYVKP